MKKQVISIIKAILLGLTAGIIFQVITFFMPGLDIQFDDSVILPSYGTFSFNNKEFNPIIRILGNDSGCSAVVIDDNYALTAAYCVVGNFNLLDTSGWRVYSDSGIYTDTVAKAVAVHISRDIALLKGNFTNFNYAKVDYMGFDRIRVGDPLVSCGFPAAQERVYCVDWKLTGSYDFRHLAKGVVIQRGCSGGPVFNQYGNVIGVNSAVRGEDMLIGPVVGVLNDFGIEPQ